MHLDTTHLEALLWMILPVFVAGGSALLSYYVMQAKMEIALARERESLAEARATISSQKITMEERIKATEESTKRVAMDEFMQDFRVEERSYMRENRTLTASRRSMIMQERLFFRNIPLSNWIEREMVVEEGHDLDQISKESIFTASTLPAGEQRLPISKVLGEGVLSERGLSDVASPRDSPEPGGNLVAAHAGAFGIQ